MNNITPYPSVRVFLLTVLALILVAGCASGQALVAETPIVVATPTSVGRPAVSFDGISFQYAPSLAARVSQDIIPPTRALRSRAVLSQPPSTQNCPGNGTTVPRS
jgi:hypothetical protein